MASLKELESAFMEAHKSGDKQRAGILASEISRFRSAPKQDVTETVSVEEAPAQDTAQEPGRIRQGLSEMAAFPGELVEKMGEDAQQMRSRGWENLGALERMELVALSSPQYLGRELLGLGKAGAGMAKRTVPFTAGSAIGRLSRIPGVDRLLGSLGAMGGEIWAQSDEDGPMRPGAVIASGVSALTTGKPTAGMAGQAVTREAAKEGAINVALTTGEKLVDEGRLPSLGETAISAAGGAGGTLVSKGLDKGAAAQAMRQEKLRNIPIDATMKAGREAGYVFIPSARSESAISEMADVMSGQSANSSALANVASKRNQEVTNELARKYLGASKNMPFSEDAMVDLLDQMSEPYRKVSALSKQAEASVEMWQQANSDAKKAWRAYDRNPSPELRKFAEENEQMAQLAFDDISDEAKKAKQPGLIKQLEEARVKIAKWHLVDRATNYGDGTVSAKTFKNAYEAGAPLTSEGELIAKMNLAFPGITRDISTITTVGGNKIPFLGAAVRKATLSRPAQAAFSYQGYPLRADYPAEMAEFAVRSGGRQVDAEELEYPTTTLPPSVLTEDRRPKLRDSLKAK